MEMYELRYQKRTAVNCFEFQVFGTAFVTRYDAIEYANTELGIDGKWVYDKKGYMYNADYIISPFEQTLGFKDIRHR